MNPYWNCSFFEFFSVLFSRIVSGALPLMSDEVQLGTLAAIAISCGLLGPFLVLKRMTMFVNSLSHTILLGIVVAFLFAQLWAGELFSPITLLIGSFFAACITAFLTAGLVRWFHLPEDASIGMVFSVLFALGILFVTLFTRDVHLGVEVIMGNADVLQLSDFLFASFLAASIFLICFLFYRQLQISAFDGQYASTLGIRSSALHFLLLFLTAAVCVGAFRAVGVLLVLAFLTGPYLTARLFSSRLSQLLWISPAIGIFASLIGVALSRHLLTVFEFPLSTGGIVVCVIGLFYGIAIFLKSLIRDKISICCNEKRSPS
ncbi:MAG TPA: metal ABC transporter permease [Chlamydiales bacterium]|nr:metal ABC transporter permease [Chlamydiales bacterium]